MAFKDRFKNIDIIVEPQEEPVKDTKEISAPLKLTVSDDIKGKLSEKIALIPVWFEYSDEEKTALVETFLETNYRELDKSLSIDERKKLVSELLKSVYGFGELDIILANENVSSVLIKENSLRVLDWNNNNLDCGIEIKNVSVLCKKLISLSGSMSGRPVLKFCFKDLSITVIMQPVSSIFIYIKKRRACSIDFEYLVKSGKIDVNIREFLTSIVKNKKGILIAGIADSGKSFYTEAMLKLIDSYSLFQENEVIKSEGYICGNLSGDDFENILEAVKSENPEYFIFDLNNGFAGMSGNAIISTIRADSALQAVTKLAARESVTYKLTEKQAKANIASKFEYLICLDGLCIASILKLSLNKAGSLVMAEILKHNTDGYSYKFEEQDYTA